MALYRTISMNFWMDAKITDEFTPEDKFFYLYLFTNPHTNLCGCYEISKKQMAWETGYSVETIDRLMERFEKCHKVIVVDPETREVLLVNWHKYNWTSSEKFRKSLLANIEQVKSVDFRGYLLDVFNNADTVSIPYKYGMDTSVANANTNTVTNTNTNNTIYINNIQGNPQKYPDEFEKAWQAYPRKKEKASAYKAWKARLKDYSEAQLIEAAVKYAEECKILGTEERFIKHGSTFWGPSLPFTDYLAEDYRPPDKPQDRRGAIHNFDERDGVDYESIQRRLVEKTRK